MVMIVLQCFFSQIFVCLREGILRKNCCSSGFCPNYLPPPLPQFGQLVQLFSGVEIQDWKVSLGLDILYNTLYIYSSLKFKLLAFWRKYTFFIGQKCTYEKVPKIGAGPPPLIWTKFKRTAVFHQDTFPIVYVCFMYQTTFMPVDYSLGNLFVPLTQSVPEITSEYVSTTTLRGTNLIYILENCPAFSCPSILSLPKIRDKFYRFSSCRHFESRI